MILPVPGKPLELLRSRKRKRTRKKEEGDLSFVIRKKQVIDDPVSCTSGAACSHRFQYNGSPQPIPEEGD
jgi:hypothetical protein